MFYLKAADGLELRLLTEAHTHTLHALIERNRAYLRDWLSWVDSTRTLEDARRMIRFGLRQHARHDGLNAGVWYHGALIGVVSYNFIHHGHSLTELGYWLDAEHQGRGLMTAACRAMIDYAFTRLALQRVEIRCAVGNDRSRAIPERLGFTLEGISAQLDWVADHYVETIVYSLSAADWQAQEGKISDDRENCRRGQL
jgi:ribosomal-protein-serine acetyltransferase